jgi:hypothetical protein
MSSSDPFHDLCSSNELNSQDYLHVPTPSVLGRTDSESPFPAFPEHRATPSNDHYEMLKASTPCLRRCDLGHDRRSWLYSSCRIGIETKHMMTSLLLVLALQLGGK